MNEMLNYIFKSLNTTQSRMNIIRKTLRNQKWFNQFAVYYMAMNIVYMYAQKLKTDELEERIDSLRNDMDKLDAEKGAK